MRTLGWILMFLNFCGYVHSQETLNDFNELSKIAGKEQLEFKLTHLNAKSTFTNYDLTWLKIRISINPDTLYISGNVTSYFTIKEPNTFQVGFYLSNDLSVDSVFSGNNPLTFTHTADKKIMISLSMNHQAGEKDSVTIYYHGIPTEGQANGSFRKGTHGNAVPIISTLSEPYGSSDWFPCKDDLNDKVDSLDMWVSTPPQYRAAGNGLLVDSIVTPSFKIWHWKHRYPITTYLISTAVTNYAQFSQYAHTGTDSIEILNYVYPEELAQIQQDAWYSPILMESYNQLYGLYPFSKEKYGHAQANISGGMEHQTMTSLGGFNYALVSHEMAHQWFGDAVTCGSWQDIWLNESFATYSVGLLLEWQPAGFKNWRWDCWQNIVSLPGGSVFVYDTTVFSTIFDYRLTYQKGAMVLHMLRSVIGDTAFFSGLRNYLTDENLHFGFAFTSDLKHHFEQSSGKNLGWYFDQWIYKEGYPNFSIQSVQYSDQRIKIHIQQHPSHPSVPFFKTYVPMKLYGKGGEMNLKLWVDSLSQTFYFQPNCWVDSVLFDPDYQTIAKADTVKFSLTLDDYFDSFKVFPNPVSNIITINRPLRDISEVEMLDVTGKLIFSEEINNGSYDRLSLDLSLYAKGIYFLKAKILNRLYYQKIMKL